MSGKEILAITLTTSAALVVMKELRFPRDGLLTPVKEDRAKLAEMRMWRNFFKFFHRTRTNAEQSKQVDKLMRFYREAKYGPALSRSLKRMVAAGIFWTYQQLSLSQRRTVNVDAQEYLRPILEAAGTGSLDFSDFEIARKFRPSRVNIFLAEYSLLMVGKRPMLSFGELRKILQWEPANLRRRIRDLRRRYGPLVVPLKPGAPGRPST